MSELIVYTSNGCSGCKMVKKQFEKNGIDFKEVNLSESPEDAGMIKSKGFSAAPIIEFDGEFSYGFNPDRIRKIIKTVKEERGV